MFKKMTDGDVMVYIRNAMLQLSNLAQERNIRISMNTGEDGYVRARAGEYTVTNYSDGHIDYSYEPISKETSYKDWIHNIFPQSIWFGQPLKEEENVPNNQESCF